jgi:hypothetical protein
VGARAPGAASALALAAAAALLARVGPRPLPPRGVRACAACLLRACGSATAADAALLRQAERGAALCAGAATLCVAHAAALLC